MYADPALIRANPVRVNFNDAEAELIDALVKYVLSGQADYAPNRNQYEQPQLSLSGSGQGPQ